MRRAAILAAPTDTRGQPAARSRRARSASYRLEVSAGVPERVIMNRTGHKSLAVSFNSFSIAVSSRSFFAIPST